ncbi:MAG TPA: DUF11 domain-containing protein, partial [Thermoplasmatales archaeon]|nr:DUF11 domain-containing protein [Thermoplasmatales archaeon]
GPLGVGSQLFISFDATVIAEGIHVNEAQVSAYCENTSSYVQDEDNATIGVTHLSIEKYGPDHVQFGEYINYTLVVTNMGPSVAMDVIIQDVLPDGLLFNDASPGYAGPNPLVWGVPSMDVGTSIVLWINATVGEETNETFTNYASVTSGGTVEVALKTSTLDEAPPWSWLEVTLDPNGYVTRASTFRIYGEDDSGMWKIYYDIDGVLYEGNWNEVVIFQLNELWGYGPGMHSIEYWAVDFMGNEERPHHHETYVLDAEGPTINISFNGIYELTVTGKYQITTLTTIGFTAEDDGVGVERIDYRLNDGDWMEYEGAFTLPEGFYHIYVIAHDWVHNVGEAHYMIQVGGGEPVTVCHIAPEQPDGNNGWYVNPVTVSFEATDEASGVAFTKYRVDGGEWTRYEEPFELGDGLHHVEYYSTDNAGLAENVKTKEIMVDLHPPEISIEKPKNWLYIADRAILPLPGNRPIIIGRITMIASASDARTSGMQNMLLYIDGDLKADGNDHVQYMPEGIMMGIHRVTIVARDVAGNEAVEEIKFFIAEQYCSFEGYWEA